MKITFDIPSSVWYDALNPLASEMQGELGLPEPIHVKRGKGASKRYVGVDTEVARELARYLRDRAETMLSQDTGDPCDPWEKRYRSMLYSMRRTAERLFQKLAVS